MLDRFPVKLSWYTKFVAAATAFLIFAGGLVTSTGSGLSVPDWPLSFGTLFPKMTGGVFFEHGHRLVAGTVVILTMILAFWVFKVETRKFVKGLCLAALGAIVLQAVLGGTTVLLKLPPIVSVAHACLAQIFFGLVVTIAVVTSKGWRQSSRLSGSAESRDDKGSEVAFIQKLAIFTTILIYMQIILGAVMRHVGAGLAIPDFPLAFGYLIPPGSYFTFPVAIHFAHRVGAAVVSVFILWTTIRVLRIKPFISEIRIPALLLLGLLFIQLLLGASVIWTQKAVIPTTFHVAVGGLLFAASLTLTLFLSRAALYEPLSLRLQPTAS